MAAQLAPAEIDVVIERALAGLPDEVWRVVDTRRVGSRGPRADFVVVGPPGVFVIGCSAPQERARARAKLERVLTDAASSVAALAGVRRDEVHAVVCVTGDDVVDAWRRGVVVCAVGNLVETLVYRRGLLAPDEVSAAALAVGRAMRSGGKHRA